MKVVITNAYRWRNKGDAGILLGIIEVLKKIYGDNDLDISVFSFTPDEDSRHYLGDSSVNSVESNIINPNPYKPSKIGKFLAALKVALQIIGYSLGLVFFRRLITRRSKQLSLIADSDLVIVCGGGFLGGKKYDSIMHLVQMWANTLYKKPTIIMGASIEPFKSKLVEKATISVIKRYDAVIAREIITKELLGRYIEKERIFLSPDMAFMLPDPIPIIKQQDEVRIGITVRKWNFPDSANQDECMEAYLRSLADSMRKIIAKENAVFYFIPQVIVGHGNDADVARIIKNMLSGEIRDKFVINDDDLSPAEIKQAIGGMDVFLGTRMHSNIFAISMAIPTVAIAYEKKTYGIMHTVGLDDFVIDINTISADLVVSKVHEVIKNKKTISRDLLMKMEDVRRDIITNVSAALKVEL